MKTVFICIKIFIVFVIMLVREAEDMHSAQIEKAIRDLKKLDFRDKANFTLTLSPALDSSGC